MLYLDLALLEGRKGVRLWNCSLKPGVITLAGCVAGKLAKSVCLPKLLGYLLAGLLAGPRSPPDFQRRLGCLLTAVRV